VIEHIVIFKFDSSTTERQKEDAIIKLKALEQEIPDILDLRVGRDFSGKNQSFDLGLTVCFKDRRALEVYGPHPKHQAVVTYLKKIGLVEKIIIDFEV
jgi:hypothetical protein